MGTGPTYPVKRDCSWVEGKFEKLQGEPFECASDPTFHLPKGGYNCIAYALGQKGDWWWPSQIKADAYWPHHIPREATLPNFIWLFEDDGYRLCEDGDAEYGFEKVAIYCESGEPTHASRALPDGRWVSKLGDAEDIIHRNHRSVEGAQYGAVKTFLKRPNHDFKWPIKNPIKRLFSLPLLNFKLRLGAFFPTPRKSPIAS
jgi:hypothetical protein